ncbi:MAG: hypothetical protein U0903_11800 [Planctomycetales bacterium]
MTDAIRFWERGRLIYNGILIVEVVVIISVFWPAAPRYDRMLQLGAELFVLAVLANVCYCAAYVPELLMQMSDCRGIWGWGRWVLFTVGLQFAFVLALAMAAGMVHALGGNSF